MEPAAALRRIAYVLERDGAESYKVRAFRNAAEAIDGIPLDDLRTMSPARLRAVPGVGKTSAQVVMEAVAGEQPEYLQRLESVEPPALSPEAASLLDQIQGDCHSHSDWSDGGSPIREMAEAARELGHRYWTLTDHSPRLTVAHGLNPERLRQQLAVVADLNREMTPFRILTGIEVDILEDGSLDQDEELLAQLDVVVASAHSKLRMEEPAMTRRMVRAIESPHTDILGHCTGRLLAGRGRPPSTFDAEAVFTACADTGTAVEINSRPERLDPPEPLLSQALALGCVVVVDTDAHAPGQLEWQRNGCEQAARVGVPADRIMNARPMEELPGLDGRSRRLTRSGRRPPEYHEPVSLPVSPPVAPMLAKLVRELPEGDGLFYEPKWDGFRCIVFRDGDDVVLGSRNEKPLTRYFPELVEALRANVPDRCVLDGEIVIVGRSGLEFDALSQRIHPAESRVELLSRTTPASFVAFDLLALGDADLQSETYADRRRALEGALSDADPPIHLTPATDRPDVARDWFSRFEGAGLDGVVVKPADLRYQPDKRVMLKVKHERTADCVVGGFRWHKSGEVVGSLLLGLFDDDGVLHHVGVASGFSAARREEFVGVLEPYRSGSASGHPWLIEGTPEGRVPGGQSRWTGGKDLSWEPVRIELVAEVAYDHLQVDRFRHATSFIRWRTDRSPDSCTYSQLDTPVPTELGEVFGSGG